MDFAEAIAALAQKVHNQRDAIHTEEATKNAFVMPLCWDMTFSIPSRSSPSSSRM